MCEPVRSLEARYYIDPAIFEAEKSGLLRRTWQFACHASQLEQPGDYVAFDLGDESLFSIRGRDGVIRTFYNVCQHRAHQLVSGTGSTRVVVCPYHAWTYELTGALRAAPNATSVPGFDRSRICLTEVRTEEFLGFVFVNPDPDAAPMDDWFPEVRAQLQDFVPNWADLRPLEWIEIPEKCNWKVSVENYSECYHCSLNHATFATGVIRPETYDIQPQGYCLRHTTECNDLGKMSYDIESGFPNNDRYSSWFLWPMFSFQVYPGNLLNTYHWRAVDAENVVVWRGWYSAGGEDNATVRRMAIQDRATTVEEDIHLVESVQRGLKSRGYVPGPLVVDPNCGVNSEHSVMHLQRWMREAVDGLE
ncbi:aromatic ring-hydroxylating oxygenase subunit alpha [Ovoidimarina sediminis]|uniref:aromatic ring-hydroxylating oxygenase subunit alpha n=1 Tax=Ovoidimarina sediminis TaxID=3079856 RepID=UPI00290D5889|nr:aromatic ring-hydroxylating dioxygenase subunit alpha [Rhodophyticola sp. MJ-SS7]MDU8945728.1 aromatic ring-hydroxylating dioxygenase subunit alpha [Rhodophyticola sp. MJ-SS7]